MADGGVGGGDLGEHAVRGRPVGGRDEQAVGAQQVDLGPGLAALGLPLDGVRRQGARDRARRVHLLLAHRTPPRCSGGKYARGSARAHIADGVGVTGITAGQSTSERRKP
ncbi:hypothetical protein ACFQV2_15255 [Actinokineospora soli]|uniref:Uncharacterized protein n=1 Tax=Actinokineospora soli TaxID=1048753 RepID=A0ABW2TLZ0_9PSEU